MRPGIRRSAGRWPRDSNAMRFVLGLAVATLVSVAGGLSGPGCRGTDSSPSASAEPSTSSQPSAPVEPDQPPGTPVGPDQPDQVYKEGDWQLQVTYRNKGTRSEGLDGVLLHRGEVVRGGKVGEVLDTDLGRMEYLGGRDNAARPWDPSGWLFEDRRKWPGPSRKR